MGNGRFVGFSIAEVEGKGFEGAVFLLIPFAAVWPLGDGLVGVAPLGKVAKGETGTGDFDSSLLLVVGRWSLFASFLGSDGRTLDEGTRGKGFR